MNILTSGSPELCTQLQLNINKTTKFEYNFEQIIAYTKLNQLTKLCIYMDVWNVYGKTFNGMRGQSAAEKIHKINPTIPILIWDGREYKSDIDLLLPPAFQVSGKIQPIANNNEIYLSFDFYNEEQIINITNKFFNKTLTFEDIPKRNCLIIKL
ncbi:MAG: hypothetical protein PHF86_07255 [Candidatus Nanoarchaeia archaeon]|jgi:hypothetical protein|nr:hypothetical protein [Candidatus Nanoarchaeia archaeon]